ncbi:fibronectin type III domain-containing protein [Modestobacter sp. NPDC049651]|uniref:fibronectin type III domain-containing protein n=1 Tax=unclassified Modestobacter TaxID=2643866 RepID=UPI0033E457C4
MGSTAGRRGRLGAVGAALAAGGLLTGCTATGDAAVTPAAATAAAPASSWFVSSGGGSDVPENRTGTVNGLGDDFYVPQPPRPDLRNLNVPYSPVGVSPTLSPEPDGCGGATRPRRVSPGVTPGRGSAVVTWQASDQPEVLGYRVSAVSQQLVGGTQPAPVQRTVDQVEDCQQLSVTVAGLQPGVPYVFWLEEQTASNVRTTVRWVQVGTSDAVVIG